MKIKIQENTNINYKTKHNNNETQNTMISFADTLKNASNEANSSNGSNINNGKEKITLEYLKENYGVEPANTSQMSKGDRELYFAFKAFCDIFGNSITSDCFREDSTINIRKVIQNFGDQKISDRDLTRLNRAIDVLYRDGYLTEEDYNYATNWISNKLLAVKIKIQEQEEVKDIFDSTIGKSKKCAIE